MTQKSFETNFGYYPKALSLIIGSIQIETLPNLEETVAEIEASDRVYNDWVYPGLKPIHNLYRGDRLAPYPARIFGLPKTHLLIHGAASGGEHVEFLVWALSFFIGMRLTTTEAGFLDATPIKPGKLVDFVISSGQVADAIDVAEKFWTENAHDMKRSKLVEASIHALFLVQYRQNLQFERFIYIYTAFDACFKLATLKANLTKKDVQSITHANRIKWMCDHFKMPVPSWADPAVRSNRAVAAIRNDAVHEALFFDEPLGFAATEPSGSLNLELEALVCRLIVALIGVGSAAYLTTPIDTRQRFALEF